MTRGVACKFTEGMKGKGVGGGKVHKKTSGGSRNFQGCNGGRAKDFY